jgi:hypothetical protein
MSVTEDKPTHPSLRSRQELVNEYLTPTEQEQIQLVLEGKCPHNQGWEFVAFCHNDSAYKCVLCSKTGYY